MNEIITIRDASAEDHAAWLELWESYNAFYQAVVPAAATDQTWQRILDPHSATFSRVAECNGRLVGFCTGILHDSTWTTKPDCYLEDLFVDQSQRGKGIGRKLIEDLITQAKAHGWSRLYWHTHEDNPARKLYDQFAPADGFVRYRLQF